jgi:hypothetical protein
MVQILALSQVVLFINMQFWLHSCTIKYDLSPPPLSLSLSVDQFDVSLMQEALHLSGVGAMSRKEHIPVSQLHSAVVEMYSCLKVQKPILGSAKLQQAQELCSNWLQMNYQCSMGGKVEAGSLKITLCLLSGGKAADKARCESKVA